jgi:hypothetical protein
MHINEAAYSNSFSTMLRVTRDSNFGHLIEDKDTLGVEPAPKSLKRIKVRLEELPGIDGDTSPRYAIKPVLDADVAQRPLEEGLHEEHVGVDGTSRTNGDINRSPLLGSSS